MRPSRIAFSGVRELTPSQDEYIRFWFENRNWANIECAVTGSQFGVDTLAAKLAAEHGIEQRVVIVPGDPARHNPESLEYATEVIRLKDEKTSRAAYRRRNVEMVRRCDLLVAFPGAPEASAPYSGTWATVRIARRSDVPVREWLLERR